MTSPEPPSGVRADGLEHPLALELAQDHVVRTADDVREDVEAAAVGHPDHDLARAVAGGELDRLVEHRHHHVEPLDRELLLPEEAAPQVLLHPLDLGEPPQQRALLVLGECLAVATRLDRRSQPDALLVVGDVLDLVGQRPAVRLAQVRKRVGECLARNVDAQDLRRNLSHQLLGQPGLEALRLEGGVPHGLAPKGSSRAAGGRASVRLDERHRSRDCAEQERRRLGRDGSTVATVRRGGIELADALDDRARLHELLWRLLEEGAPGRVDRLGEARYCAKSSWTNPELRSSNCCKASL